MPLSDYIEDETIDAVKMELLGDVLDGLLIDGTFDNPGQTLEQSFVCGYQDAVLAFARRLKIIKRDGGK